MSSFEEEKFKVNDELMKKGIKNFHKVDIVKQLLPDKEEIKSNFEKDFPSLKGKLQSIEFIHNRIIKEKYDPIIDKFLFYSEEDIQSSCIDKQRVKEAMYGFRHLSSNEEVRDWMEKCEKELGLENDRK